jgi:hypothetical protein
MDFFLVDEFVFVLDLLTLKKSIEFFFAFNRYFTLIPKYLLYITLILPLKLTYYLTLLRFKDLSISCM